MSCSFTRITIMYCDGCGTSFGHDKHFRDTEAIRKIADKKGWTFPHRVTAKGTESPRVSDVCPACTPSWVPVLAKKTTARNIAENQRRAKAALMQARSGMNE